MKIAVIGASGKSGSKILEEAKKHGHEVLAIVRNRKNLVHPEEEILEKDLFDLTPEDFSGIDAVVDAFGAWGDRVGEHSTSLAHLTKILAGTPIHLYVVGGAGSLYVDSEHQIHLSDTPDFPAAFKPLAQAMGKSLSELRNVTNVHWTYISPAASFEAEGAATGNYVLAGEEFTTNTKGESAISYADYALGVVDIIESQAYDHQRVSLRW